MKAIEYRVHRDIDKSFSVFSEVGQFFPCPWHYHPEYELVLVNRSSGRRMVGDHIGYFEEDDLVLMGPGIHHVWVNDSMYINGQADHLADAVVVHFLEDFMIGQNMMELPELEPLKRVLTASRRGLLIHGDTKAEINRIMRNMLPKNGIQRLSELFNIFDILNRTDEYEPLASPNYMLRTQQSPFSTDRHSKITDYIMRNFDKEISLNEVASEASMAITTFCNFFKTHYRMTFVEYLNTIRIAHVCKLLAEETDRNIVEIAYECGYNNLANFNRQFKRLKGMSPTEYRRKLTLQTA